MSQDATAYLARWVCPVEAPVIENGAIIVRKGKIAAIGAADQLDLAGLNRIDLGSGALIPGLVNAHSHLEFSWLEQPIGEPGIEFTQWIRQLMSARSQTGPEAKCAAISGGLTEAFASGTWWVGEIATAPVSLEPYAAASRVTGASTTVFLEQLGRTEQRYAANQEILGSFFHAFPTANSQPAISPHAPYSVALPLLESLCNEARQRHCPIAMHLAETKQELELLNQMSGPLVDMLQELNVWDPNSFRPPIGVTEILQQLASCPRSLIIHGNYLDDRQLDLIAANRDRMSIVYCPRTHAFFKHDDYRLRSMLSRNINVAIGTDSRASTPDLNLFSELQLIAKRFSDLPWQKILQLGTINGARALTLEGDPNFPTGSLQPGAKAALSHIRPHSQQQDQPIADWIFAEQSVCEPVLPAGKFD